MISITIQSNCCGCNACVQRCPKHSITMNEDKEGFLYPQIDTTTCIDCGLCEKVCPVLNQNEPHTPLQVFAAKNKNEDQRLRSSSGGIFILLAEQTIRNDGVVFGARFDMNWEVEHCYAETIEELEPLMRSKYVQSRIGNSYKEAEQFLMQGRQVLFVGTSCQIAGLRKFLRKDYVNLLAVDFICHGVPSPGVWRRYLEEIKSVRSEAVEKNTALPSSFKSKPEISGINFREKQLGGYGWKKYGFVVQKSPSEDDQNTVLLSNKALNNPYMRAFLQDLILRPSCYSCPAKAGKCGSDITLADFWGAPQDIDDDKGTGLLVVHTRKGSDKINSITSAITLKETSYEYALVDHNISYRYSVNIPKERALYWNLSIEGKTIEEVMAVINYLPPYKRAANMIKYYLVTAPMFYLKKIIRYIRKKK